MLSPSELRWCVGKFIYPRGGTTLLHYMPLHDFHLEDALSISAIVSLRTQRIEGEIIGSAGSELSHWMDITAAERIASLAMALLDEATGDRRVIEYDTGLGLVFEALKLAAHQRHRLQDISYTGVGHQRRRLRFEMLHAQDSPSASFASDAVPPVADLVIVNHANGIREESGPVVAPCDLIPQIHGSAVLASRVAQGDLPQIRTTVAGKEVELPALDDVLRCCRASGGWYYHYVPGHDASFFLPEEKPDTGLLIAYRGETGGAKLSHFRPITAGS